MKILPAAKFKEQCLALLDEVNPEGILVTKRGKPVAKLIPVERGGKALLGILKGKIRERQRSMPLRILTSGLSRVSGKVSVCCSCVTSLPFPCGYSVLVRRLG